MADSVTEPSMPHRAAAAGGEVRGPEQSGASGGARAAGVHLSDLGVQSVPIYRIR